MSSMSEEMARRMAEDQASEGSAPGTGGESPPADQQPPAGESKADTAGGGTPETIPYARFKEVNDQLAALRGYKELADYGYDPDSLGRLAAFEAQYMQDPRGTIAGVVEQLDLPQEQKDQITAILSEDSGDGGAAPEDDQKPVPVSPEVQEALNWIQEQRAAAEQTANDKLLDSIVGEWDRLDKVDQVPEELLPNEEIKLMFISQAAREGGYTTTEELAEKARAKLGAYQESLLGGAVQRGRRPGSPLPVPGGAPPAPEKASIKTFADANKAVLADLEAGRLPGVERGS